MQDINGSREPYNPQFSASRKSLRLFSGNPCQYGWRELTVRKHNDMRKDNDLTLKRFIVKLNPNFESGFSEKMDKKRATIYFDPDLFKALRIKAAATEDSISGLVNEAVRRNLLEDSLDLKAFEERVNEPLIKFEDVVKKLQKDGKL